MAEDDSKDSMKSPIAKRLAAAAERKKADEDVTAGHQLLNADFRKKSRSAAPGEFGQIQVALQKQCESFNRDKEAHPDKLATFPGLEFAPSGRVSAGKYAICLYPMEGLADYSLEVVVGLHPNAAQFILEPPSIVPETLQLRAAADEGGFYWQDLDTGERRTNLSIVGWAFARLSNLLTNGK